MKDFMNGLLRAIVEFVEGWRIVRAVTEVMPMTEARTALYADKLRREFVKQTSARRISSLVDSGINRFEDLWWLFSSNRANFGFSQLAFDEAAQLYKHINGLGSGDGVEIGRFVGGSTVLIAAAMHADSTLVSIDAHYGCPGLPENRNSPDEWDDIIKDLSHLLDQLGLRKRVELIVGDSKEQNLAPGRFQFAFVDGDHSYEGVKSDYLTVLDAVRPGGSILFHDAAPASGGRRAGRSVAVFMDELLQDDRLIPGGTMGTIVWFKKRG